jgi:hypothetical protein
MAQDHFSRPHMQLDSYLSVANSKAFCEHP